MTMIAIAKCSVLAILLAGISGMLSGCESVAEKATRLSCHWNKDIQLNGCDRWTYADCISNCEYCVGASGTLFGGQSDECAQLKCGAFCANAEGDPKCAETYSFLCNQGKQSFATHQNITCDVNCNSAHSSRSPTLLLTMGLTSLSLLQTRSFSRLWLLVGLLFVAVQLQGCVEPCSPGVPQLPGLLPDFYDMQEKAGCKTDWNSLTGTTCASNIPVLFAKKGWYHDSDYQHMLDSVEREQYECTRREGNYCAEWTAHESSCKEEDFGVCTCVQADPTNNYCDKWQCISKEVDQHLCWVGCCGKDCSPCIECGTHGSSPMPINHAVYNDLMAAQSVTLGSMQSSSNQAALLAQLRSNSRQHYTYGGTCIASHEVRSVGEIACQQWREIETEVSYCECLRPSTSGHFCMDWKCEEKDVGQFSILFTVAQSYENLLVGQETERYSCSQIVAGNGSTKCGAWHGDISSMEEVEVTQCTGCSDPDSAHCKSWVCDEYEFPKVWHEEMTWPYRFGMSLLHLLLLSLIMVPCFGTLFTVSFAMAQDGGVGGCLVSSCSAAVFGLVPAPLVWIVFFVRYIQKEARWWHPTEPLLGLALTGSLALTVGMIVANISYHGRKEDTAISIGLVTTMSTFYAMGLFWTTGIAGAIWPVLVLSICSCLSIKQCMAHKYGESETYVISRGDYEEDPEDNSSFLPW